MANTNQDIESRLCAYIDGELSDADRAEIERHLEAHPQHRRMIEELIQTRQMLADLPHAIAPGDLSDGLQGQLERSILLGEGLNWTEPRRSGRKVALGLVMLVLAVGLTATVFITRRAAFNAMRTVAIAPSMPPSPVERALPTTLPSIDAVATPSPVAPAMIQTPSAPVVVQMYLVVRAPDPWIGGDEIAGCLTADGFSVEPMPIPTTQPTQIVQAQPSPSTQPTTQPAMLAAYTAPATQPSTTNYLGILKNLPRQRADQLVDELFKQDPELKCQIVRSLDEAPAKPLVAASPTTLPTTQPAAQLATTPPENTSQIIDLAIIVEPLPPAPVEAAPAPAAAPPANDASISQTVSPLDDMDSQQPPPDDSSPTTKPVGADDGPG
jgi:Putative zinc-finger